MWHKIRQYERQCDTQIVNMTFVDNMTIEHRHYDKQIENLSHTIRQCDMCKDNMILT